MKAEAPTRIPFHIHQFHFLSLDAEFQPPPPSPLLLFAPRVDLSTASLSPASLLPFLPSSPRLSTPSLSFPSDSSEHLDLGSSSPTLWSPFSSWVGSFSRINAKAALQTPNFFLFFDPNSEVIFRGDC